MAWVIRVVFPSVPEEGFHGGVLYMKRDENGTWTMQCLPDATRFELKTEAEAGLLWLAAQMPHLIGMLDIAEAP